MKILSCLFCTLMMMTTVSVHAAQADEDYGLGIILGDPTGLSGKMKWDNDHSVDAAFAYSTGKHNGSQFHMDYLWDRARAWHTEEGPLAMYYGLGGRVLTYNDNDGKSQVSLGPRGSIGVSFNFMNPNIEVFGELAAILELTPSVSADLDAGIGARIRF